MLNKNVIAQDFLVLTLNMENKLKILESFVKKNNICEQKEFGTSGSHGFLLAFTMGDKEKQEIINKFAKEYGYDCVYSEKFLCTSPHNPVGFKALKKIFGIS